MTYLKQKMSEYYTQKYANQNEKENLTPEITEKYISLIDTLLAENKRKASIKKNFSIRRLETDLHSLYNEARSSSPLRANYILKQKVNSTIALTESLFSESKQSPNLLNTSSRQPRSSHTTLANSTITTLDGSTVRKRSATCAEPERPPVAVQRTNSAGNIKDKEPEHKETKRTPRMNFDAHVRLLYHRPPEQVIKILRI